jgi:hypothetical protein
VLHSAVVRACEPDPSPASINRGHKSTAGGNSRGICVCHNNRCLIFLHCIVEEIFTDINQATMLSAVLNDVLQNDLVQEAIRITLIEDTGQDLIWELTRHPLPKD